MTKLTIQNVEVVGLVAAIPTAIITIIRLGVRTRARNLGLDDAFAASSLAGLLMTYVGVFLHFEPNLLAHYSFTTRYWMYYILSIGFYSTIWAARLSILFTVIRITPPHTGTLRALHFLAWSFGVAWVILVAQMIWVCEKKTTWKMARAPQCPVGLPVATAQLISDIIADSILIVAPVRLLWCLDNKSCPQRRRLLVVFSSSIVTTITSLIHAYTLLRVGGFITLFAGILEACSSLLVCNLSVIISLIFRIFRGGSRPDSPRAVDCRLTGDRDGLRFRQETESPTIENDPVINIGFDKHIQSGEKADPEALSLPLQNLMQLHFAENREFHDHGLLSPHAARPHTRFSELSIIPKEKYVSYLSQHPAPDRDPTL